MKTRHETSQLHDSDVTYELFRQAIVERSDTAWEHIYRQYSRLVETWVRHSGAFASSGESSEFFMVEAFTRFWQAISPERFVEFPTLRSLLSYLQSCASSAVVDCVRTQPWSRVLPEEAIPFGHMLLTSTDKEVMDRISREEFWRYVTSHLHSEAEHVIIVESFILGMKPGHIYDGRPDLFTDVIEVYAVKRKVLERLRDHKRTISASVL